jgi:hypothetical protein
MQHWVHPGRQTSHAPARFVASDKAASMIWISSLSPTGSEAAIMSSVASFVNALSSKIGGCLQDHYCYLPSVEKCSRKEY